MKKIITIIALLTALYSCNKQDLYVNEQIVIEVANGADETGHGQKGLNCTYNIAGEKGDKYTEYVGFAFRATASSGDIIIIDAVSESDVDVTIMVYDSNSNLIFKEVGYKNARMDKIMP